MRNTLFKEKIFQLQKELDFLKQVLIKEPNFKIDEETWKKVKSEIKKTRKKLYRKIYGEK
jgi:hypothetical protein